MWLTISVIVAFCIYISYLFQGSRYFYLHSVFLIPLYPAIFFIDHNSHYLVASVEPDSIHYLIKLLPLYLNIFYLALKFRARKLKRLSFTTVVVNVFMAYNVVLSVVYAIYHASALPFFYVSYSVPLFAIFFNSRNFHEEVSGIRSSVSWEKKIFQLYFLGFIFVYAASIYYSILTSVTTSLLDSRGVGSIFASTSALIYCCLYAPLLAEITGKKWPHVATIAIGVTSLSKTALLLLPAYSILLYRKFKKNIIRNAIYYSAAAVLLLALVPALTPPELAKEWQTKFLLGNDETLLDKSYRTRLGIYEDALHVIHDAPYGIGVGNFERFSHNNYRDPHNFVLATLSESGVAIGLLFVLVILGGFARTVNEVLKGSFGFNHFSFISMFLIYVFAGGVLQTTGNSDLSPIYYTPFYGVMIFQLLNWTSRGDVHAAQAG